MPFNLDCPRCKQPLVVPSKKAGSYANCPRCKGRIWVPELPPAEAGDAGLTGSSVGQPITPAADSARTPQPDGSGGRSNGNSGWTPPLASASPVPGNRSAAAAARPAAASAPQTPPPPPPVGAGTIPAASARPPIAPLIGAGKTARFVSAQTATSGVQLAADGKLPELRLEDAARTVEGRAKGKAVSPLVLFAVLSLSVALSMVAVLVDFNAPNAAQLRRKSDARQRIEANYFPLAAGQGVAKAPERYQRYLAEAARAHVRGDLRSERWMYNKVLDLLRTERDKFQRGLTGSRERDKELEDLIVVLLSDD